MNATKELHWCISNAKHCHQMARIDKGCKVWGMMRRRWLNQARRVQLTACREQIEARMT